MEEFEFKLTMCAYHTGPANSVTEIFSVARAFKLSRYVLNLGKHKAWLATSFIMQGHNEITKETLPIAIGRPRREALKSVVACGSW